MLDSAGMTFVLVAFGTRTAMNRVSTPSKGILRPDAVIHASGILGSSRLIWDPSVPLPYNTV